MPGDSDHLPERRHGFWLTVLSRLALIVSFIVLANIGVSLFIERLDLQVWPSHLELLDRTALVAIILYVGLMAVPFLPGVEIGLVFMMVLGTRGIIVVYVCTLLALCISFWMGRSIPGRALVSVLLWLRLTRAADLLDEFTRVPVDGRLEFMQRRVSARPVSILIAHRYLLLALLLNMPGNVVVGGGGGLGVMAGASRLFPFPKFLLLVSVAILPGPILIVLSDQLL